MKLAQTMIAWTPCYDNNVEDPHWGEVKVGQHPDETGWSDEYDYTEGMCNAEWTRETAVCWLYRLFNKIVVRDRLDAIMVHSAFLVIDEYRETLSDDTPGALNAEHYSF